MSTLELQLESRVLVVLRKYQDVPLTASVLVNITDDVVAVLMSFGVTPSRTEVQQLIVAALKESLN